MPQGFGAVGPDSVPIFTLPGNPVSAYVSFEVFVRPVLRKMLGVEPLERPVVLAVAGDRFSSPAGKRSYLRGILDVVDGRYVVGCIEQNERVLGVVEHAAAALGERRAADGSPRGDQQRAVRTPSAAQREGGVEQRAADAAPAGRWIDHPGKFDGRASEVVETEEAE